jgi:hypothetical protein
MRMRLGVVLLLLSGCPAGKQAGRETDRLTIQQNLKATADFSASGLWISDFNQFQTGGPFPASEPWKEPVTVRGRWAAAAGAGPELIPDRTGMLKERYESVPCPDRFIWDCAEVWATGVIEGGLSCIGIRLVYDGREVTRSPIARRAISDCPVSGHMSEQARRTRQAEEEARATRRRAREEVRDFRPL